MAKSNLYITVNPDKFKSELSKLIAEYGEEVTRAMKEVVPKVTKKATEEVRSHAPVSNTKRSGTYKKAITSTKKKKPIHQLNTLYTPAIKPVFLICSKMVTLK